MAETIKSVPLTNDLSSSFNILSPSYILHLSSDSFLKICSYALKSKDLNYLTVQFILQKRITSYIFKQDFKKKCSGGNQFQMQ